MVRFYHSVYRIVYHPQVCCISWAALGAWRCLGRSRVSPWLAGVGFRLPGGLCRCCRSICTARSFQCHNFSLSTVFLKVLLPIRRGLMFQTASASSRVQAKNGIITQGIEIMSLMCKAYESVTTPTEVSSKKVRWGVHAVRRRGRNACIVLQARVPST